MSIEGEGRGRRLRVSSIEVGRRPVRRRLGQHAVGVDQHLLDLQPELRREHDAAIHAAAAARLSDRFAPYATGRLTHQPGTSPTSTSSRPSSARWLQGTALVSDGISEARRGGESDGHADRALHKRFGSSVSKRRSTRFRRRSGLHIATGRAGTAAPTHPGEAAIEPKAIGWFEDEVLGYLKSRPRVEGNATTKRQ